MFADQAYTLHSVALIAATIICVLCSAVLLALVGIKLYKRPLFWMAAAMLLFLVAFTVIRFLLLIAPTETTYIAVKKLQIVAGVVSAAVPLMFLFVLMIRKHSISLIWGFFLISILNIVGTVAVLKTNPDSGSDFYPAASYFVFCCFCLRHSKSLFPELAGISLEAFLNDSGDLILVFDSSGRLMKANSKASEVFGPHEGMALQEFNALLKDIVTVHEDKTMEIVTLSGKKYYQHSETAVTKKGGVLLATVRMFFDVTEMTVLKSELKDRSKQLKAQGEKLKEHIKIVERLEAEEQKEIVMREIQQAMGLKMEKLTQEIESDQAPQNLPRIIENCRDIMSEVRMVLSGLVKTERGSRKDD